MSNVMDFFAAMQALAGGATLQHSLHPYLPQVNAPMRWSSHLYRLFPNGIRFSTNGGETWHIATKILPDRGWRYARTVRLCEYRIVPTTSNFVRIEKRLEGLDGGPSSAWEPLRLPTEELTEADARDWLRGLTIVEAEG